MGMREWEASMLAELRTLTGKRSIRQKDIMEWSTSPITARDGETLAFLPMNAVHVAYVEPVKKVKS